MALRSFKSKRAAQPPVWLAIPAELGHNFNSPHTQVSFAEILQRGQRSH